MPPPTPWIPQEGINADPRNVTSNSIVFVGDSLTHIGTWRKYFPNVETANQGIGGNTTSMVLARLQPIIDAKPKKLFLLIGANDMNFGVEHPFITLNQRKIIERVRKGSPNTKIFVQSVLPFGKDVRVYFPSVSKSYIEDIKTINKALAVVCFELNVPFINLYNKFADETGHLKPEYTKDQLHLEPLGYELWVSCIDEFVSP
jgi:lysophospholipase L1-like esterase